MHKTYRIISTKELISVLGDKKYQILDIRPVDAYNGWKLNGEKRGGHIREARSLPLKWSDYIDWIEIVKSKGITPQHSIILYGYHVDECTKVAALFEKAGNNNVFIYENFSDEWSSNPDLPMDKLKRYQKLVHSKWVYKLISGKKPESYSGNKYIICHAHYQNEADYEKGHIPGAIALDTLSLESPETWNRRSSKELRNNLLSHGITSNTTVILYGRFSYPKNEDPFPGSSAGHLGAIRCAVIMLYAGIKDVRVLNGGLQSWEDDGYKLTKEETNPSPAHKFGNSIPGKPNILVDIDEAKKLIASKNGEIVSVRSWSEWIGETSGYNYIEKKGRIPGAVFGNCGSDAYHMENYRNLDHTTREYHEIAEMWREAGIEPHKKLAFYCGTGWRGSEAFLNAWLMGWSKISVFDGGWYEWSNDPKNPVLTDMPKQY